MRRYFSVDSTKEIMQELRPRFYPFEEVFVAQGFMVILLPTASDQVDLWLSEALDVWEWIQNMPSWDSMWVDLFSRVAEDRFGKIDWSSSIPRMFTTALRMFDLPVGSGNPSPLPRHEWPEHCKVFQKGKKEKWKSLARMLVYMLTEANDGWNQLKKLMQAIETFYHPSNSGKWTHPLNSFLQFLARTIVERLRKESDPSLNVPPAFRTSHETIASVVETLRTNSLLAMFGRQSQSSDAHMSLRYLGHLCPELVYPAILSRVYPSLESLTETHRTIACLMVLGSVGRNLFDRSHYPSGLTHLAPLLHLSLPGIDVNDPVKSVVSLLFLLTSILSLPIVDATTISLPEDCDKPAMADEDKEILNNTTYFEEWTLRFLERIFLMFENVEVEKKSKTSNIDEGILTVAVNTCEAFFMQLSDSLYDLALNRLVKFVDETVRPNAAKHAGQLCSGATFTNPSKALAALLPGLLVKVKDELEHGAGSVRSGSDTADNTLIWNLIILAYSVNHTGPSLLPYLGSLKSIISMTIGLELKTAHKHAAKLIRNILRALLSLYPSELRSAAPRLWNDPVHQASSFMIGNQSFYNPDLNVEWHMPSESEIGAALELIRMFLLPELDRLDEILATLASTGSKGFERFELNRILTVMRYFVSGMATLIPDYGDGSPTQVSDDVSYVVVVGRPLLGLPASSLSEKRSRIVEAAYCIPRGSALYSEIAAIYRRMCSLMHSVAISLMTNQLEDDIRSIKTLIKINKTLLSNRGVEANAMDRALSSHRLFKKLLKDKGRPIKEFFPRRIFSMDFSTTSLLVLNVRV